MVTVPIFIILLGLLVTVSSLTSVPWAIEPTGQSMETLAPGTAVSFDNPQGVAMPAKGTYRVASRHLNIDIRRAETGEVQHMRVLVREPVGAPGSRPGMVFMHGAGRGMSDNSFGDVATDFASAGFVTAVPDKPLWSTGTITRDYPASAVAYDKVVSYLRGLPSVDSGKVGIYATSESTWIAQYMVQNDRHIAFQILLSPMVYAPRQSLGFFVAQDFSLVGAHDGYQSIVRRLFHADLGKFGSNFDIDVDLPRGYAIPTMVAYGSKDVMTAQVEGTAHILDSAHRAGNRNVTVRSYSVGNHVLRLGDEAEEGTPLADDYVNDMTTWTEGTLAGLRQTSEPVAGATIHQSIAVPTELHGDRTLTVYGFAIHIATAALLLVSLLMALAALVLKAVRLLRRRNGKAKVFGFLHGFGGELLVIAVTTLATLVLFASGLGQVIMAVVRLGWGGAPDEDPGMMHWSWPVVQLVSTLVVWAWSRVLARLAEVAQGRGIAQLPPSRAAIRDVVSGREPVLASRRFGRVYFWVTAAAMFGVLLVFAFWGFFVY
ncbi:alpha/beta hydrolase [Bifidobacterium sp. ESL0763]|nr:alpha/beta hydrolase [Bifidobacterium sp. ESL0763]MDF7664194.1 alpha/beta hydrolase [Bifidobacterium sp. ESL0763]